MGTILPEHGMSGARKRAAASANYADEPIPHDSNQKCNYWILLDRERILTLLLADGLRACVKSSILHDDFSHAFLNNIKTHRNFALTTQPRAAVPHKKVTQTFLSV